MATTRKVKNKRVGLSVFLDVDTRTSLQDLQDFIDKAKELGMPMTSTVDDCYVTLRVDNAPKDPYDDFDF
jgi:hypothetical protein